MRKRGCVQDVAGVPVVSKSSEGRGLVCFVHELDPFVSLPSHILHPSSSFSFFVFWRQGQSSMCPARLALVNTVDEERELLLLLGLLMMMSKREEQAQAGFHTQPSPPPKRGS
jgi:hypothetical protein